MASVLQLITDDADNHLFNPTARSEVQKTVVSCPRLNDEVQVSTPSTSPISSGARATCLSTKKVTQEAIHDDEAQKLGHKIV